MNNLATAQGFARKIARAVAPNWQRTATAVLARLNAASGERILAIPHAHRACDDWIRLLPVASSLWVAVSLAIEQSSCRAII